MEKNIEEVARTPFEIPKFDFYVLLECIADVLISRAKERADKKIKLISASIRFCYVCHASPKMKVRYRKISGRIHHIYWEHYAGLWGFTMRDVDLAANAKVDGFFCHACEKEHGIIEKLKAKAQEAGVKISLNLDKRYGRGK
jgi:hypothetical protein